MMLRCPAVMTPPARRAGNQGKYSRLQGIPLIGRARLRRDAVQDAFGRPINALGARIVDAVRLPAVLD